jgi:NAD(P)-dependent dehydrogenase (short-subunit alcohol dehydrogenase family)
MAIAQKTNLASAAAYAVSKAALDMWTVKLGLQLKADGKEVVVRALHPGWATVSGIRIPVPVPVPFPVGAAGIKVL